MWQAVGVSGKASNEEATRQKLELLTSPLLTVLSHLWMPNNNTRLGRLTVARF